MLYTEDSVGRNFEKKEGFVLKSVIKSVSARSIVECIIECIKLDDRHRCVSISYMSTTMNCSMSDVFAVSTAGTHIEGVYESK